MIDPQSRKRLALALHRFSSGRLEPHALSHIDIDERDDGAMAVAHMARRMATEIIRYDVTGHRRPSAAQQRDLARWIAFLQTGRDYRWPEDPPGARPDPGLNVLTLGWWNWHARRRWKQFLAAGDYTVWPFISRAEYQHAISQPRKPIEREPERPGAGLGAAGRLGGVG